MIPIFLLIWIFKGEDEAWSWLGEVATISVVLGILLAICFGVYEVVK